MDDPDTPPPRLVLTVQGTPTESTVITAAGVGHRFAGAIPHGSLGILIPDPSMDARFLRGDRNGALRNLSDFM